MATVLDVVFPNGPLSIPRDDLADLNLAIGSLVVLWGFLEASLNISVVTVFDHIGGKHHSAEIPVALGRKLKFLRRSFRLVPALAPYADEGRSMLTRVGTIATARNNIVHGFISNHDPKTQIFTFTNLGSVADKASIKGQAKFTPNDIIKIGQAGIPLTIELALFAERLVQTFVRK